MRRLVRALLRRYLATHPSEVWGAHLVSEFVRGDFGRDYGLGPRERQALVSHFERVTKHIESGTPLIVHVLLAREILSLPKETRGDVVECGAWKGASAASLSLVCEQVGRKLIVCDSFAGLPDDGERRHVGLHTGVYGHYKAGMFEGSLEEVRGNIEAHGALSVCSFVKGYFAESLTALEDPVAFAFLDVDLDSSTRDCLKALWPLLNEGGFIYSDDAGDLDVVKVFFDTPWWQKTLGCAAPGFVGSGCGLPLNPRYSSLGYTRKQTEFRESAWRRAPFLHYPEEEPGA